MAIQEDKFNITLKVIHPIDKNALTKPLCIQGMPGIANAGKGALDYISKQLGAKKVMEIFFSDFPSHVKITPDGCLDASKIELLHCRDKSLKRDVILLTSDSQPTSNIGMNVLSKYIANTLKDLGVTMIISLAARPINSLKRSPKVYVTATSQKLLESFSQLENVNVLTEGIVIGMNGIVPVLSNSIHNIDGVILLSESCKMLNHDIAASYALIKVLKANPGLDIDLSPLEGEAKLQWETTGKVTDKRMKHRDEKKPEYIS
ncbi:MAG: PAC2 family protein [Candidatus Freyarchaeota archaeon]